VKKITVALDVEREVRYNINAMVDLEDRFNLPLPVLFDPNRIGVGLIRAMLMIGLKHGGMDIQGKDNREKEEAIGELIQEHWLSKGKTLEDLMNITMDAFKEAGLLPKTAEEGTEQNPTKGAGAS
jgi:hypothetical protein